MICPKCGHLMRPRREKEKITFFCPACGYEAKKVRNVKVSRKVNRSVNEGVIVIKDPAKLISLPIDEDAVCPKCGNKGAYVQVVQTRSADEPPTRIYTCTQCRYVWREYM